MPVGFFLDLQRLPGPAALLRAAGAVSERDRTRGDASPDAGPGGVFVARRAGEEAGGARPRQVGAH